MIIIDTNALVVLLIGMIDVRLFKTHKRTSIYEEKDFQDLVNIIGDLSQLIVLPNVWTETDNLLNDFGGNYKYPYLTRITELIKETSERFISSAYATESPYFGELGLTDSLLLTMAKECKMLITSDSRLSDYAIANNVRVYDMVKINNERL